MLVFDKNHVKESFNEYKKIVEKNIMSVDYLYSGDVVSSLSPSYYSEIRRNPLTSPSFIINCLKQIYSESFDLVKKRAREVSINNPSPINIPIDLTTLYRSSDSVLGTPSKFIFASKSTYKYLGYDNTFGSSSALPSYFFEATRIVGAHSRSFFVSPEVEEEQDAYILYAVDSPFQSLVYSLQNMSYDINVVDDNSNLPLNERDWEHKMTYQLYDCKFSSVKVIIKNLTKVRDEKINQILS